MTKIKKMVSAKKVMAVMVLGLISGALLGAQQAMTLTPELESQVAAQLGSKQVTNRLFGAEQALPQR